MAKRGRKSAADAAVVIAGSFGKRPDAPAGLTERQAEIWLETVASEAAELFNTAALRGLLKDYCLHRDAAERISGVINTFEPNWIKSADGSKRYHGLLKMRELETRAAACMATKLRLTNQSRYTPQAAATAAKNFAAGSRPWEFEG